MQTIDQSSLIYALAAAPNAERIFAARDDGLYISADGGNSWQYAYQSLLQQQALPTLSVALSPAYARDHMMLAGTPGAILKSVDGGETWTVFRFPDPAPLVNDIAFSPTYEQDGTAFAVTGDDGVFCSYDGGISWTNWNFGLLDANGLCIAVSPQYAHDRMVFAGTSTGLFRSRNGGKSWQVVDLPCEDKAVLSLAVSQRFEQDQTLFVGVEAGGLYRSTDAGVTWVHTGEGIGGSSVYHILLDPDYSLSSGCLVLMEQSLLLSGDQGLSFRPWPVQNISESGEITAVCLLDGMQVGASLFAAQFNGGVLRLRF